jgi:hypothetical protein
VLATFLLTVNMGDYSMKREILKNVNLKYYIKVVEDILDQVNHFNRSRDRVVGLVTGYVLDDRGVGVRVLVR